MSRFVLALVLVGAMFFGWWTTPDAGVDPARELREPTTPPTAVCPITVDRVAAASVAIGATTIGDLRLTVAQGGEVASDTTVRPGDAGGVVVAADDLGLGGRSGLLVESEVTPWAASVITHGTAGVSAVGCQGLVRGPVILAGGSTRNEESLHLVLVNPYGADATAEVSSSSEAGLDSADELAVVAVPARSTVVRDVSGVLPLRSRISITVTPARGLVHAFLDGSGSGSVAVEGVEPGGAWTIPVPTIEGAVASVVIATNSPVDVAAGVELRTPAGDVVPVFTGVVPARGQVEVVLGEEAASGMLEIVSDGHVAAALVLEGDAGRAIAHGVAEPAPEWLLPGAGRPAGVAWVAVPGDADATIEFQSLTEGGPAFTATAAAGTTTAVELREDPTGWFARADADVAILWSIADDVDIALAGGVAVESGI